MIYCIGDSFTYGHGLSEPGKTAWPIVLGNLLNAPVTNLGKDSSGNTRIAKRTIDVAFRDDAELVILAWVSPYRIEFFDEKPYDLWPGRNFEKSPIKKPPTEITKALTILQNDQFDLWLYRKWMRDIILTQNLLKNQNKKYLMARAWGEWGPIEGTEDLWNKIDWNYFIGHPTTSGNTDYETFGHWYTDLPLVRNHPSDLGHQRIAQKFYEHIRNFGWFS
jgi:hypothetical protein